MNDAAAQLDVLRKIADVARLAGVRGQIDEQLMAFSSSFSLPDERSQRVLVRQTAQAPDGSPVITILSPCVTLDSGWLKGISRDETLGLLRANEKFPFARYGISKLGGQEMVVASMDVLLDSLDATEFGTYIWSVASVADAWEATHKQNKF